MKDKLMVVEDGDYAPRFRLQWWLAEEDDMGGVLGDGCMSAERWTQKVAEKKLQSCSKEDWEHWTALLTAMRCKPDVSDSYGFAWSSRAAAVATLRAIKVAFRAEKPMPEWAVTAAAEGWKPPRGWKP